MFKESEKYTLQVLINTSYVNYIKIKHGGYNEQKNDLIKDSLSYWIASTEKTIFPKLESNITIDTAIIGGGIAGITTAYLLKNENLKVASSLGLKASLVLNLTLPSNIKCAVKFEGHA